MIKKIRYLRNFIKKLLDYGFNDVLIIQLYELIRYSTQQRIVVLKNSNDQLLCAYVKEKIVNKIMYVFVKYHLVQSVLMTYHFQ